MKRLLLSLAIAGLFSSPAFAIEQDKILHATAGALTASAVDIYAWNKSDLDFWERGGLSVGLATAAGLAKEGVDYIGFGTPDAADVLWTAGGGLVSWLATEAVQYGLHSIGLYPEAGVVVMADNDHAVVCFVSRF